MNLLAISLLPAQSEAGTTGDGPPPWKLGIELLRRDLTLTTVVAGLASQGGIDEWTGGLLPGTVALDRVPARALDGRDALGEHALEARRAPAALAPKLLLSADRALQ